ncbi:MAG: SAM-dependent methyltransferase [Ruminococcaceae bacterium]|nr:SAM-dependent methyltransferase [Oscillospiraceae bacterium]
MREAKNWVDYELLDASDGERLERWGEFILIRPDPQVVWATPKTHPMWKRAHAHYHRSNSGGGHWETLRPLPDSWQIGWEGLRFNLKPMGFKHTGLFPEQAVNWADMAAQIRAAGRPVKVLNLFGYTGGATLACVAAGAHVTHVDASRGMVAWGRENAVESGLADRPMRWLVDDCGKFVQREMRRGNKYDAILMDPPSYGRGPNGEVWKLEDQIFPLVRDCVSLLSDAPLFFYINSYTTGLSPSVMRYILHALIPPALGGTVDADEIGLPVTASGQVLPCGSTARWRADGK